MREQALRSQLAAARDIWKNISAAGMPADRWLGNHFHQNRKKFGSRDRRFLSETIYSLFRHKRLLEAWARALGREDDPAFLVLLAALAENLVEFTFFQEVAKTGFDAEAPPDLQARLAGRLLPEGLKAASREEEWAVRFSSPDWLVKRWLSRFGPEETEALLRQCQARPPLVIRANTLRTSRAALQERFEATGWKVRPTPVAASGLIFEERENVFDSDEFREGLFEIQDEGSQILCEKIAPGADETVWDVCAGGGGKSLAMAAIMRNKGRIVATDIRPRKLDELKKRASRAGIYNIFPADLNRVSEIKAFRGGVDKILVDAPCSGTGTLRRNPDAKWKLKEQDFEVFQRDQIAIVEKSLPHLRKGGRLYYATCSLEREENESVMEEIFRRFPGLKPAVGPDPYLRLWPHRGGTDGFFLAIAVNTP